MSDMPSGPPDFTGQYNTPLSPDQEAQYQQWLQLQSALNHRDMSRDLESYDMRGAFLNNARQAGNAHYPDTFKKPNHPGFSDQSIYHGADGHTGGQWTILGPGSGSGREQWSYAPSPTTLQMHGVPGVQNYLTQGQGEGPPVQLILPQGPTMQDYVRQKLGSSPDTPY